MVKERTIKVSEDFHNGLKKIAKKTEDFEDTIKRNSKVKFWKNKAKQEVKL